MGHFCASKLDATCITTDSFSISHGEKSVRFLCRHGHNFYLSLDELKTTYLALNQYPDTHGSALDQLPWCSKCRKHTDKVKERLAGTSMADW